MGIIIMLIVGGIIGWLAGMVMGKDIPGGIIGNIIAGLLGAVLGSYLPFVQFGPVWGGVAIIPAFLGSLLLIFIVSAILGAMRKR